jgi:hypothetical protein
VETFFHEFQVDAAGALRGEHADFTKEDLAADEFEFFGGDKRAGDAIGQ